MDEGPVDERRKTNTDLDGQKLTVTNTTSEALNVTREPTPTQRCTSRISKGAESKHNLPIDLAKQHLSDLGPGLFYRALDLNKQNLEYLGSNILNFKLICRLDVSNNHLSALGPHISKLSNLSDLNASNNKLTRAFDFGNGCSLQRVNFSNNNIEEVDLAGGHKHLRFLDLSNNMISDVRGLSQCRQLRNLNLSNNDIRSAEGLETLPITSLNLEGNKMENLDGCSNLSKLITLNVSKNRLSTLNLFNTSNAPIQELNVANNNISQMADILPLQKLRYLHKLDLRENPLCKLDDYRDLVVFLLPRITLLDGIEVNPEDTVRARNLFRPNPDLCAALDHMTHTVYGILEGDHIREYIMPGLEHPYPFLILTGPPKLNKSALISRLCKEFDAAFGQAISHTTRTIETDQENGREYNFVKDDEFQELIRRGAFIQMSRQKNGELFGLTKDALENVAIEGKAAVCHLNLDGVRTMQLTHLKPRYVLVLPSSDESYQSILDNCGDLTAEEKAEAWEQFEELGKINREKPGYFDMIIPAESSEHAYQVLRQLVVDFLGHEKLNSENNFNRRLESRDSVCISTPQSRQKRAEVLLEAIRHATPNIQVQSAPARCTATEDRLLREILDTEMVLINNESSEDDWTSVASSMNTPPFSRHLLHIKKKRNCNIYFYNLHIFLKYFRFFF